MRDGFIKVAAATPEIKVAHCDYNAKACIELIEQDAEQGVKVLVLPELVLDLRGPVLSGHPAAGCGKRPESGAGGHRRTGYGGRSGPARPRRVGQQAV